MTYTGNLTYQVKDNNCPAGTGNICNVDPQVTNASLSAFNALPQAGSPLIDKASTTVATLATDYLSLPRPMLAGYDIGAMEYQGTGGSGGGTTNLAPIAVLSASATTGSAPLVTTFSAAGSSDPDGTIASYAWSFGDGSSASGSSVSHSYVNPGTFVATLTVTDNAGAETSQSVSISVTAATTVITAPSGLSASSRRGTVSLRWTDNSTSELGFHVERAPSATSVFARIGDTGANATSFVDSEVSPGTYLYRVQAFDLSTGAVSTYSAADSARVR